MNISKLVKPLLVTALALPFLLVVEPSVLGVGQAAAQKADAEKPKRKTKKVDSIRQKLIKPFEKIQEHFETDNFAEVKRLLAKMERDYDDLNNIERAYIHNYRGNICFSQDNLNCALREFKLVTRTRDGLSDGFYNQMLYVIAQVLFSQEKYKEALGYAETWFKTQSDPSADAYMLVGQAHYMLKAYDKALPKVQKGIQKYVELGSVPKEGWLNLLSSIYRQKNQYKKMLPIVKQLVQHYPKKAYLLTMGGIYNELDDQAKMTAMYQAMYDQGLITSESELVTLASLLLSRDNPHKASTIMAKGIASGSVKKNLKNYRIYSQALYLAKEYKDAIDPLAKAARLASDGKVYNQLGQSYIALNRWKEAESSIQSALKKGKLSNTGQVVISLGLVQFELKKHKSAIATFQRALKYDGSAKAAANWIDYVKSEQYRIKELQKEIIINTDVEPATT